jgi:hypothetical protein
MELAGLEPATPPGCDSGVRGARITRLFAGSLAQYSRGQPARDTHRLQAITGSLPPQNGVSGATALAGVRRLSTSPPDLTSWQGSPQRRRCCSSTASRSRSPPRPRSTASTSCAPASPARSSKRPTSCAPTSSSRRSSAPSAGSRGRLELRAIHGRLEQRVKAHVFFSMLSPTTSPGTCAGPGSRCCSTTSSRRPGRTRSPGRAAPPPPSARPDQAHHRGRALPLARHSAHRPLDPRPNTIRLQDPGASFEQLTQPTPTEARALG